MRSTQRSQGAGFLCETRLSQGETPKEIQPLTQQVINPTRKDQQPNEAISLATRLSLGETPIRDQIIGKQKYVSSETRLSRGETRMNQISVQNGPKDGGTSLATRLSLGETPKRSETVEIRSLLWLLICRLSFRAVFLRCVTYIWSRNTYLSWTGCLFGLRT